MSKLKLITKGLKLPQQGRAYCFTLKPGIERRMEINA